MFALTLEGEELDPTDFEAVGRQLMRPQRYLARTQVGSWQVSTVFLVLVHPGGPWETMVFGPEPWDRDCWRYWDRASALAGHRGAVEAILSYLLQHCPPAARHGYVRHARQLRRHLAKRT